MCYEAFFTDMVYCAVDHQRFLTFTEKHLNSSQEHNTGAEGFWLARQHLHKILERPIIHARFTRPSSLT